MCTIVMNHATVELPFNEVKSFVDNHPIGDIILDNNCEDYIGCPMIVLDSILGCSEMLFTATRKVYEQAYADCVTMDRNGSVCFGKLSDAKQEDMDNYLSDFDWDAFEAATL